MRTMVKLAISATLALMDEIKNSTPEQRAEMQAQVKKKIQEKHQAAQSGS